VTGAAEERQISVHSEFSATISLDPRIYSREAILKTCYWYTAVAYFHVPESPPEKLNVHVSLRQTTPTLQNLRPLGIEEFIGEFCNSLLDFELRRQVTAETASVREIILAKAFSESGLLEDAPPGTVYDPVENEKPSSLVEILNTSPAPLK
jgi:His-Xaa-Ser system protein HxsD